MPIFRENRLMASARLGPVLRHLHKLAGAAVSRQTADLQLLRRFAENQDEDAFAELMRRHGPLVLNTCRRILGHEQDAEDAFQAAFLVLARKAASIRKGESVGSFLYGVAYRIAIKERGKIARRRQREQQVEQAMPTESPYDAAFHELQILLDEGLNRLPEKYRAPFVLCGLEGKSKSEAAGELGWKEGTVSSRLARARKELQQFLSRKGITLAAALTAAGLAENVSRACIPPLLAASALRTARLFASGSSAAMETARAVQLAESVLRSMAALPWKSATALLMAVSLAVGGVTLAHPSEEAKQPAPRESPPAPAVPRQQAKTEEKPRTDRYGDPLPEGALARLGTIRFRQGFLTRQVAFSPNGKIVACAGAGRGVCLWDAATGKELRQIGGATHANSIAFSPNGKILACVLDVRSGGTALYETGTGRKLIELPDGVGGYPIGLAYAPDGKTIAGGESRTNKVLFFDAATGEKRKIEIPTNSPDEISRITWSPDSKKLAWIGKNGSVHLWDAINAKEDSQWKAHDKDVCSIAFSLDGKTLATGSQDETVCLWDITTHKKMHTLDGKHKKVRSIVFSRDGRLLASGHSDGTIALWDASQGKARRRWQAHSFPVCSLDFSPEGKTLVSGAMWECGPRLWDVATGTELQSFAGHTAHVEDLRFSRDGKRLLSMGLDRKILDWDLTNGHEGERFRAPFRLGDGAFDYYLLSPRGDLVASWGYHDDKIRLWDAATGKERRTLGVLGKGDKGGWRQAMAFSPDGRLLAIGTRDGILSVWDAIAGVERQRCKGFEGRLITCVVFSPDGKKVGAGAATGGVRATIGLWDVNTGKSLAKFASREWVSSLAFSPDGKILASASWHGSTKPHLWDAATGKELRFLEQRSSIGAPNLYAVTFSPDGKWLAGAGADHDQKVHVWEVNTGLEVRTFRGHVGGGVLSIAYSPDGRTLASGGGDSSILLWDFTGRIRNGRLQSAKWRPRQLEQRWIDLASTAGPQAVQALWDLVAAPEQAVALLRQRIKPVEPADAQRVEQLIRDLDSDDFQTRSKATQELEKIVDGAAPMLREKLAEKPSLEMRQRIKQVLSKLEPTASAERLRELRAIQVLEYADTNEAREFLRTLAKGLAESRLTREAKASLQRLAR
jgi:RNA polymerase sigma factor (sigma-70 family)